MACAGDDCGGSIKVSPMRDMEPSWRKNKKNLPGTRASSFMNKTIMPPIPKKRSKKP